MKIFYLLCLIMSLAFAEDRVGVSFIGDEKAEKSKIEIKIFEDAAKEMGLNYRWLKIDDVDTKDCKYILNYIANRDDKTKFLSVNISLFVGDSLDSIELAMSIKTDDPEKVGKKMVIELVKLGMQNITLPQRLR